MFTINSSYKNDIFDFVRQPYTRGDITYDLTTGIPLFGGIVVLVMILLSRCNDSLFNNEYLTNRIKKYALQEFCIRSIPLLGWFLLFSRWLYSHLLPSEVTRQEPIVALAPAEAGNDCVDMDVSDNTQDSCLIVPHEESPTQSLPQTTVKESSVDPEPITESSVDPESENVGKYCDMSVNSQDTFETTLTTPIEVLRQQSTKVVTLSYTELEKHIFKEIAQIPRQLANTCAQRIQPCRSWKFWLPEFVWIHAFSTIIFSENCLSTRIQEWFKKTRCILQDKTIQHVLSCSYSTHLGCKNKKSFWVLDQPLVGICGGLAYVWLLRCLTVMERQPAWMSSYTYQDIALSAACGLDDSWLVVWYQSLKMRLEELPGHLSPKIQGIWKKFFVNGSLFSLDALDPCDHLENWPDGGYLISLHDPIHAMVEGDHRLALIKNKKQIFLFDSNVGVMHMRDNDTRRLLDIFNWYAPRPADKLVTFDVEIIPMACSKVFRSYQATHLTRTRRNSCPTAFPNCIRQVKRCEEQRRHLKQRRLSYC